MKIFVKEYSNHDTYGPRIIGKQFEVQDVVTRYKIIDERGLVHWVNSLYCDIVNEIPKIELHGDIFVLKPFGDSFVIEEYFVIEPCINGIIKVFNNHEILHLEEKDYLKTWFYKKEDANVILEEKNKW